MLMIEFYIFLAGVVAIFGWLGLAILVSTLRWHFVTKKRWGLK